jgi:hypothetical protein
VDSILTIRGRKVILDSELSARYGVATGRFNEAVARNLARFPPDFMFRLTPEELDALRSQIAISKPSRGGRRYAPYAFTEHGAIMAATILNSATATEVSVFIVRAFVELRGAVAGIADILSAIRSLMSPPPSKGRPIGFVP